VVRLAPRAEVSGGRTMAVRSLVSAGATLRHMAASADSLDQINQEAAESGWLAGDRVFLDVGTRAGALGTSASAWLCCGDRRPGVSSRGSRGASCGSDRSADAPERPSTRSDLGQSGRGPWPWTGKRRRMAGRAAVSTEGGPVLMGSDEFCPEERPGHRVAAGGFWRDTHPVIAAGLPRVVDATGRVTVAEHPPNPADYPGVDPSLLVPGSLVYRPPPQRVSHRDYHNRWTSGACWHRPEGLGSTAVGCEHNPVTHIACEDTAAYAAWPARRCRPTVGALL
jgi:hypothetical protein